MSGPAVITEAMLHDLIDGRLEPDERAQVIARVASQPQLAVRVAAMRRQHEALRALGQEILHEPVPERLRRVLRRRRPTGGGGCSLDRVLGFGRGAAAILLASTGGLG